MTTAAAADRPKLRDIIARHGLSARAGLGQHFLLDYNVIARIVRIAGDLAGRHVIEIGPGPGGLTRVLLESPATSVVAIERDRRCIPALEELRGQYPERLRIIEADALAIDPAGCCPPPRVIVANLPYNIATRLLIDWLRDAGAIERMTLMFQKEVAWRLAAGPGDEAYGRLSVLCRWLCEVTLAFDLPPRAFTPPPKVASSVVTLVPRARPSHPADRAALERVTAAAFGQRRKMLRTSLKQVFADPLPALAAAGIDPTARAESVGVAGFCALARALAESPRR